MSSASLDNIERFSPIGCPGRTRLAVREIREITWRALVASGTSAGEAAVAADAVTFTEIHFGTGLETVVETMSRAPLGNTPVGLSRGPIDAIDGAGDRDLLTLAPLALGLVAARPASSPVLIPRQQWNLVLAGFLTRHCGALTPAFFAFDVADRQLLHGIKAGSDRTINVLTPAQLVEISGLNPLLFDKLPPDASGVLVMSDFIGLREPLSEPTLSIEILESQSRLAFENGLSVATSRWAPVYETAAQYLVADQ